MRSSRCDSCVVLRRECRKDSLKEDPKILGSQKVRNDESTVLLLVVVRRLCWTPSRPREDIVGEDGIVKK